MNLRTVAAAYIEELANARAKRTSIAYALDLKILLERLAPGTGPVQVSAWTKSSLVTALEELASRRRKPASLVRMIRVWRSFERYCLKRGILTEPATDVLRVPVQTQRGPNPLPWAVLRQAFEQLPDNDQRALRDRVMVALLATTGLKVSELVALRIGDFSPARLALRVGNERTMPIDVRTAEATHAYIAEVLPGRPPTGFLFPGPSSQHLSTRTVQRVVRRRLPQLSPELALTPQRLRDSYAALCTLSGARTGDLRENLGLRSYAAARRYRVRHGEKP